MQTLKIIKIGGNIIDDNLKLQSFLMKFSNLEDPKILVHGGGKTASEFAKKLQTKVEIINGRRITNEDTLEIITMVYAGKINKKIVAKLQSYNCNCIGLSGADGNIIVSQKRQVKNINFGFVGDIDHVNTNTLSLLLNNNITPVFCALTHDKKGQLLNTNADSIASELATGFAKKFKTELYYCFEKNGVLQDVNDNNSVIEVITPASYKKLLDQRRIANGMLPKLNSCFYALEHDVTKISIGNIDMPFSKTIKFTTIKNK